MTKGLRRPEWRSNGERFASGVRLTESDAAHDRAEGPVSALLPSQVDDDPAPNLNTDDRVDLMATIRDKIIPQLIIAHAEPLGVRVPADSRLPPTPAEVSGLARIAVDEDLSSALAFVQGISATGVSFDIIMLHLIAPAARLLGEEWLSDLRTFTQVTIGLGTLHQLIHVLGPSLAAHLDDRGSVVLVGAPSEQHTLGLHVLGEFLRNAGWLVHIDPVMSRRDLIDLVESEQVEMVGISVSNTSLVEPLTRYVAAIKKASINPRVAVMVGGSVMLAGSAAQIGATFCNDPRDAVRWLERHFELGRDRRQN